MAGVPFFDEAVRQMVAHIRRTKRPLRIALAAVVTLVILACVGMANLTPVMISMAEARARSLAVVAINNAVSEVMGSSVDYSDLVQTAVDQTGKVTMIKANTLLMNDLASKVALTAQRNMERIEKEGVPLPLGSALGIPLFSGSGPTLRVDIVLVGSVSTRFVTVFETAGINQTRHEISLEASMLMSIVVPTGANSVTVSTYVPVGESIIVGGVPDTYINVPSDSEMINLIP